MIGHALVTTVRRRRRDLAVLKTLGFVKPQVALAVCWEASTFAVFALAVGIPLGLFGGRWLWRLFAEQVGIPPAVTMPVAAQLPISREPCGTTAVTEISTIASGS
jgi:putative ABC transport system permease protein